MASAALSVLLFLIFSSALFSQDPGSSNYNIISSEPLWRRALGGKIDAYPAQGPGGDVYVVADDRALHCIDPLTGESKWIYRPGGRLRNLLMVAPDGTIYVQNDRQELFAVTPGGTGRWKLNMRLEPSALPAAAPDGRVIVPLSGGRIVSVSRHGRILWTRDESAEASAGPVVRSDGNVWIPLTDGRVIALNHYGEQIALARINGAASVLALDGIGRLWAGGFDGRVSVFNPDNSESDNEDSSELKPEFVLRPSTSRVSAILTDSDGMGRIFSVDGSLVSVSIDGEVSVEDSVSVSGGAASASADGTLFLPAADGSIRVLLPEGKEIQLSAPSVLAEPLLSQEGILISGGGDWILYGWKTGEPGPGWRQFRGDSRRSGTFPASLPVLNRQEARRDVGFFYRERMAVSNDVSERLSLLNELESYPDGQSLRKEFPWVDLIIEDLVTVGTLRFVDRYDEPLQSHGVVRARAYVLLAGSEDFRARNLLLSCLAAEEDPAALAAGFRGLGYIGTDWDGASMRLMAARYREFIPAGERLTVETARGLADLVRYNGDLSDPSGYDLMNQLLISQISENARREVMDIIRRIASL